MQTGLRLRLVVWPFLLAHMVYNDYIDMCGQHHDTIHARPMGNGFPGRSPSLFVYGGQNVTCEDTKTETTSRKTCILLITARETRKQMDVTQKNYKFREGYEDRKKKRKKVAKKVGSMGLLGELKRSKSSKKSRND